MNTALGIIVLSLLITNLITLIKGVIQCPAQPPSPTEGTLQSIFDFGDPSLFVSSLSQKLEPYSLIDAHRRTSVTEEYLMVGYKKGNNSGGRVYEDLRMVIIDEMKTVISHAGSPPDLIHQNLEKELYWDYIRSTGVYPSIKIVNATRNEEISFEIPESSHADFNIAFHARIWEDNLFYEPQPPFDAIFEVPANSRVLQTEKTMIQYQSFSLWRWRLSKQVREWKEIREDPSPDSRFTRIDNPCIKDMFLLSYKRPGNQFYVASPLIQSHLNEHWFYDMTSADQPWSGETFLQMVLVNDHLVVLTNKSLWISTSLNGSRIAEQDVEMRVPYTSKPVLEYTKVNPCAQFKKDLICFNPANQSDYKLFYNPVCYLYQIPNYGDYLIFVVEKSNNSGYSVLYSQRPYEEWRILFLDAYYYVNRTGDKTEYSYIHGIIGIIFNHHIQAFDITAKVHFEKVLPEGDTYRFIRFALPEPRRQPFQGYGELVEQDPVHNPSGAVIRLLNNLMGEGFVDFQFPNDFILKRTLMNGDTHDILFLGDQLWVAEGGGPFVYPALTGISALDTTTLCKKGAKDASKNNSTYFIEDCSFNHPDRTFVCINNDRDIIFAGKVGAYYNPTPVEVESIEELVGAEEVRGWPEAYFCGVLRQRSVFVVGYSGKVLMWYLDEPEVSTAILQKAISEQGDEVCSSKSKESVLCPYLQRWKKQGCKASNTAKPQFHLLSFNPALFAEIQKNTDGPLVPFLVDSSTAILYEAIVPTDADFAPVGAITGDVSNTYLSDVNVGQKIYCRNYDLLKKDASDNYEKNHCELYIQHLKHVERLLEGFRLAVYVSVLKSVPMLPVPADIAVLYKAQSNKVIVKVNDFINDPPWAFTNEHIGQTLYLPGNMSILLSGHPVAGAVGQIMEGYATMYSHFEKRLVYNAFHAFLMDLSTTEYREVQVKHLSEIQKRHEERIKKMDDEIIAKAKKRQQTRESLTKKWNQSPFLPTSSATDGVGTIFKAALPTPTSERQKAEDKLLTVTPEEQLPELKGIAKIPWTPPPAPPDADLVLGNVPYADRRIWYLAEPECHYIMTIDKNPLLTERGGRISLDIHERLTFTVRLRSITALGKITMHRPLLVITNTNADLLEIQKIEKLSDEPQMIKLMLVPTGFAKGVATISVRSLVGSLKCKQTTSITLTILLHREAGRRLFPNYPIPICKTTGSDGLYPRPWKDDIPGCVTRKEILDPNQKEIHRFYKNRRHVAYITLPVNYRPPSFDGADIPTSRNVYNVDPSKPFYKDWYEISKKTRTLTRCKLKDGKSKCDCTDNDRFSDDELYSECKQKVFFAKRIGPENPISMSMTYDSVMRDSDQIQELFTPKLNWSIIIEEVNGRTEWFIKSPVDNYIRKINTDPKIHYGRKHYNLKNFSVILLGTGLFHFRAQLAAFESFDEVSGHFLLFGSEAELNDFHMFVIMLLTIVFCVGIVFYRFMKSRRRLQKLLPMQTTSALHRKLKVL